MAESTGETRSGHPRFYQIMESLMTLHSRKNKDYAKEGKPLGNFERVAAIEALYPDFNWATPFGVTMQYLLKQFDAAMHLYEKSEVGGVENVGTRLGDVAVYATIGVINWEEEQAPEEDPCAGCEGRTLTFGVVGGELVEMVEEEVEPITVPCPRDCTCGPPDGYCPLEGKGSDGINSDLEWTTEIGKSVRHPFLVEQQERAEGKDWSACFEDEEVVPSPEPEEEPKLTPEEVIAQARMQHAMDYTECYLGTLADCISLLRDGNCVGCKNKRRIQPFPQARRDNA